MSLSTTKRRFAQLADGLLAQGRVAQMANYTQHGSTTTLEHAYGVAFKALALARGLRMRVDERSLVRGAILHDYFLYDWHDHAQAPDRWHGFTHPSHALRNAKQDFADLTAIECDIIRHHMFPFHPAPPRTKEGWLVCMADKICSTREFFEGHQAKAAANKSRQARRRAGYARRLRDSHVLL